MQPADGDAPRPDRTGRIRLVVLFGGRSAEHDISRVSASHVLRAIDPDRYDVVPIGIRRSGRWVIAEAAAELMARGRPEELPPELAVEGPDVDPLPTIGHPALDSDAAGIAGDPTRERTVVLPILHGPNGEDGTVQGLLEMAGVPYVGTGVLGSAVSMDKAMAKTVLGANAIAQPRWRAVRPRDLTDRAGVVQELIGVLGRELFVKPANMGSSIGVSKVSGPGALVDALEHAFGYDDVAVVEEAVRARELECAVLGNGDPRASAIGEILPGAEFYDFEDKYAAGVAQTVIPAELDDAVAEEARDLALRAYVALRCEGMARVDLFLEAEEPGGGPGRGLMVNEVNTIPGFTPISMYPMLWQHSGLPYPELIDELVRLAIERHDRRARFSTEHVPR